LALVTRRSLPRAAAALLLAGVLGGCSGAELDDGDLVATLRAELDGRGVQADDLRCPSGLRAAVGESVRCTFTVGGQPVDVVATISAVDGETVTYDMHTEARPVMKEVLERSVAEKLGQAGVPTGTASCVSDLPAQVGATVGCTLSGPEGGSSWTVRTTSVDGGKIDYSIEQAGPS
jgi:Domain of unknown function (DUF4333)